MPRTIKINEHPNPTGLRVDERRLALDAIRSFEDAVTREKAKLLRNNPWRRLRDWTLHDEEELRGRVYRAAYNQLTGRQKGQGSLFKLQHSPVTTEEDMDYVMESLGMKR